MFEALERLMEEKTAIVIAHRLATVRKADVIYVLEDGRIAEAGKHQELLARGGLYSQLYDIQFKNQEVEPVIGDLASTARLLQAVLPSNCVKVLTMSHVSKPKPDTGAQ